jgi:adenylyltransferase/sulfurtransferase
VSEFNITPEELQQRLLAGDRPFILDVRDPAEYQICRLEGATLIPLKQLPDRLGELSREQEMIVHCKLGGRSAKAVELLRNQGFSKIKNLVGGIDAWAQRIDTTLPRY